MKTIHRSFIALSALALAGCVAPVQEKRVAAPMPPIPVERTMRAAASAVAELNAATNAHQILVIWRENDPIERVVEYITHIRNTNAWEMTQTVERPPIDIFPFMMSAPNGVYRVSVSAVNDADLESDESAFVLFWYGQPSAPADLGVEFKH